MNWSAAHVILLALWMAGGFVTYVMTASVKNRALGVAARRARAVLSKRLQMWPRACFALILPVGLRLTAAGKIYPIDPEMRIGFWAAATLWLMVLIARLFRGEDEAEKILGYAEIAFATLAGMGFVVYGLNSLATGAPIDDAWFAAKLFLIGVALWTLIAIDLNYRSLAWPLDELALDGSTPENEEGIGRGVNHTLAAMVVLYVLVAVIGVLGREMIR